MKDHYEVLGVTKDATDEDIKQAYRDLAKKHHPDKNGGDHSDEFIEIQSAYSVLSDPEKRDMYDTYGFSTDDDGFSLLEGMMSNLVAEAMDSNVQPDFLINEIEKKINRGIESRKADIEFHTGQIELMTIQKDAIKTKGTLKCDIITLGISSMIKCAEDSILATKKDIEVQEQLLDLLSNYVKGEEPEAEPFDPSRLSLQSPFGFRNF